ncbi:MAG: rubredoxin [Desulfobacula sp.]|jgi:rubredoxin/uncharacterized membrane protein|nr:rubredoxin [Desulfobacula sp.]MBT7260100.1 rubredoxin [Desulfobacula sp.]
MKAWQCSVCKYIHKGETPPEKCPICGVDASKFVEIDLASIPEKTPKRKKAVKRPEPDALKKEEAVKRTKPDTPQKKEIEKKVIAVKETGFEKINSFLIRHHAHPVLVHTPNGILPLAVILFLLAWIFDNDFLARVAFVNLIFVVLALPLVLLTGILEWKKKYNRAMTNIFKLKILSAAITSASCAISLVWFLLDPKVLSSSQALIFILINIIMLICAGIAGYIGGKLVFKD